MNLPQYFLFFNVILCIVSGVIRRQCLLVEERNTQGKSHAEIDCINGQGSNVRSRT